MEEVEEDSHSVDVCIESLKSLKELSQLQSKFHQTERQVERQYEGSEECRAVAEECGKEVRRLKEEKKLLKDRITAIDRDIDQLVELQERLGQEQRAKAESVPVSQYEATLGQMNTMRVAIGLQPLPECQTYQAARQLKDTLPSSQRTRRKPMPLSRQKAGPSYKCCPYCTQQVSRNAVTCPHCHAPCRLKGPRGQKALSGANSQVLDSKPAH